LPGKPQYAYRVVERNPARKNEYQDGYSRNNELYQQRFDLSGRFLEARPVVKNAAIMMYAPLLDGASRTEEP
jgi:hypothetical protein